MIKQESPSSNSSDNNSPDSNPTLPGSPEAPTDTSDHSTPAGAPAGAPANAPAGTPPETIELRVCWESQVGGLIDKKMLHGLGPKSVISILEKLFCLLCLLLLPGLPPSCSPHPHPTATWTPALAPLRWVRNSPCERKQNHFSALCFAKLDSASTSLVNTVAKACVQINWNPPGTSCIVGNVQWKHSSAPSLSIICHPSKHSSSGSVTLVPGT